MSSDLAVSSYESRVCDQSFINTFTAITSFGPSQWNFEEGQFLRNIMGNITMGGLFKFGIWVKMGVYSQMHSHSPFILLFGPGMCLYEEHAERVRRWRPPRLMAGWFFSHAMQIHAQNVARSHSVMSYMNLHISDVITHLICIRKQVSLWWTVNCSLSLDSLTSCCFMSCWALASSGKTADPPGTVLATKEADAYKNSFWICLWALFSVNSLKGSETC